MGPISYSTLFQKSMNLFLYGIKLPYMWGNYVSRTLRVEHMIMPLNVGKPTAIFRCVSRFINTDLHIRNWSVLDEKEIKTFKNRTKFEEENWECSAAIVVTRSLTRTTCDVVNIALRIIAVKQLRSAQVEVHRSVSICDCEQDRSQLERSGGAPALGGWTREWVW